MTLSSACAEGIYCMECLVLHGSGKPCNLVTIVSMLVPRPSLTAFFAAVAKSVGNHFCHGCEKSCEGRPGYEAINYVLYSVAWY